VPDVARGLFGTDYAASVASTGTAIVYKVDEQRIEKENFLQCSQEAPTSNTE